MGTWGGEASDVALRSDKHGSRVHRAHAKCLLQGDHSKTGASSQFAPVLGCVSSYDNPASFGCAWSSSLPPKILLSMPIIVVSFPMRNDRCICRRNTSNCCSR